MPRRINLNLIETLIFLTEEQSVSRAAQRACVSQPAMSKSLNQLRDLTGDPLLQRQGGKMVATPHALELKEKLSPILAQLQMSFVTPTLDVKTLTRRFVIASSDYFSCYVLPEVAEELMKKAKKINVKAINWQLSQSTELELGKIDLAAIAFIHQPDYFNDFANHAFGQDNLVCVMSDSHPLAQSKLTEEAFFNAQHIGVENQSNTSLAAQAIHNYSERVTPAITVPFYTSAFNFVVNGKYLLTVPLHIAGRMSTHYPIVIKALPMSSEAIHYHLIFSKLMSGDIEHQWFKQSVAEILTGDFTKALTLGKMIER